MCLSKYLVKTFCVSTTSTTYYSKYIEFSLKLVILMYKYLCFSIILDSEQIFHNNVYFFCYFLRMVSGITNWFYIWYFDTRFLRNIKIVRKFKIYLRKKGNIYIYANQLLKISILFYCCNSKINCLTYYMLKILNKYLYLSSKYDKIFDGIQFVFFFYE